MINYYMKNCAFPVCVHCMTFNQSQFIVETMNGFSIQQTSFPFICCILDDASTDGEPVIIEEYLKEHFDLDDSATFQHNETKDYRMLFARHRTNENCYFAVYYLKYNHYSIKKTKEPYIENWNGQAKYIAICEGDDYWSDASKLQKQYDVLERNANISMCHHNYYELFEDGRRKLRETKIPQRQNLLSIAKENKVQTLTMFFRNITPLIPDELKGGTVYSQFYAMRLAEIGDIYYVDEPLAVYRRNSSSTFGLQSPKRKFEMMISNLNNMVYWYTLNGRAEVVKVLKKRTELLCIRYILHFLRRFQLNSVWLPTKCLLRTLKGNFGLSAL